jgi:hypothetical protein
MNINYYLTLRYIRNLENSKNGQMGNLPQKMCLFLEHIFNKMGSTEIVMSSVRLSARRYVRFSAGIAPRELKFWT